MRIGLDARFYGPEGKGLGRYTERLLAHLAELDSPHEFVVFLRDAAFDAYQPPPGFRKVRAEVPWYGVAEQVQLPRILNRERLDLVHFLHFNVPVRYRRPFVVTVHDLILLHFPTVRASTRAAPLYWLKHRVYRSVFASAVHRARHLLTVSEFSRADIVKTFNLPAERITVTYEAADPLPAPRPPREAEELSGGFYLSVGNAYPHKNLEGLVTALARAWRTGELRQPLVLVGRRDYFYDRIAALASRLGVASHVYRTGAVDDAELAWLYTHATAYCFPSRYEGFGLPGLEAMRAGCPVVASTAGSLPEVYGDAALLVDPTDGVGWVRALARVTSDEALRRTLTAKGRTRVERFSWNDLAQRTLGVYERCAR